MRPIENLTDIAAFVRIAAAGSLSAAARDLGLSLAVVSKRLARLETALGVRLVQRTTRRLSLTEEGAAFHERALRILAELAAAQEAVGGDGRPRGLLRVTTTAAFARRWIAPILARFQADCPEVRVQVTATDAVLDLVQAGIDLAIRQAVLPDSGLMVRDLAPNWRVACAAPDYLARHGRPETPADLAGHSCIVYGDPPMTVWTFARPAGPPVEVAVSGAIMSNDGEVAHEAALAGAGIVLKSIWYVAGDLAAGRLVRVLADHQSPASPIQAVFPSARHLAPKTRAFLDVLGAELRVAARRLGQP